MEYTYVMKNLIMVLPTKDMEEKANAFKNSFFTEGEFVINGSALFDHLEYFEWLEINEANRDAATVRADWVPATTFFALRESDDKIVGIIDIRHNLNNANLAAYWGHIGYSVAPEERNKGFAVQMLNFAKDYAAKLGLNKVMLSCPASNTASIKTIVKCGGVLTGTVPYGDDTMLNIYWIDLKD